MKIKCQLADGEKFDKFIGFNNQNRGRLALPEQSIAVIPRSSNFKTADSDTLVSVVPIQNSSVVWYDDYGKEHIQFYNEGRPILVERRFVFEE